MSEGINKKDTRTDNPFANTPVEIKLFPELIAPNGFLSPMRESMACWYYYVLARRNYEEMKDALFLEGHADPTFNFRQLFTSIAKMYGVEPEGMAKCWTEVDMTAFGLGLPRLPDEERYRFNRPEIIVIDSGKQTEEEIDWPAINASGIRGAKFDKEEMNAENFRVEHEGMFEPEPCKNDCPDCNCKHAHLLEKAEALAKEREWLCEIAPACKHCQSHNLQIRDVSLQEWKCRDCKQTFFTSYTRVADKNFCE